MNATRKQPHPVDIHVGGLVKLRRMMLGMSQEKLGEHCGITFQQLQKYEKGTNRISASRLVEIAAALGVPVAWFFDELPGVSGSTEDVMAGFDRADIALVRSLAGFSPRTKRALAEFLANIDAEVGTAVEAA